MTLQIQSFAASPATPRLNIRSISRQKVYLSRYNMSSCSNLLVYVMLILSVVLLACLPLHCKYTSSCILSYGQILYVSVLSLINILKKKNPRGSPILSEEVGDARIYRRSTTNNTNSNAFVKRNTTEAGTQITVKFCNMYDCGNIKCYCCDNGTRLIATKRKPFVWLPAPHATLTARNNR
jgi:hypothetical protein